MLKNAIFNALSDLKNLDLNNNVRVYLFSGQHKDEYCLVPSAEELRKSFRSVDLVSTDKICDKMVEFSAEECPVGVFSSLDAYDLAKFVRGGRPFISIGIEHGVAPFKRYTFNRRFVEYDCYISPTRLWADRLASLNEGNREKFTKFAYPRLDDLQFRIAQLQGSDHSAWGGVAPHLRDLVVLSWGVDFSALRRMPDREGVVYLVHPQMWRAVRNLSLGRAQVVVSDPNEAATLIAGAARVFGDFSSMTLESACFKPETYMFVDRRFYGSDCDLSPSFFDHDSPAFGRVENTEFSLPRAHILKLEDLAGALAGGSISDDSAVAAWAPEGMLPDITGDQAGSVAQIITEVAAALWQEKRTPAMVSLNMTALKAVEAAYNDVLGRKPDYPAAMRYAQNWVDNPEPVPVKTIALYNTFVKSAEAQKRWAAGNYRIPRVTIEPFVEARNEMA